MADYPASLEERAIVAEAMNLDNPTLSSDRQLIIGGIDYDRLQIVEKCVYFTQREEGDSENDEAGAGRIQPAIVLEATLAGRVQDLLGQNVKLHRIVDGVAMQRFEGEVLESVSSAASTTVMAASPGFWLSEIPLGEDTTFPGQPPSTAAFDVMSRNDRYRRLNIPPVPEPVFSRAGATRIPAPTKLSEVLEEIRIESGLVTFDDAYLGAVGWMPPDLSSPIEPVAWYEVGRHIDDNPEDPKWEATPKFFGRYANVWVYRVGEDDGSTETIALLPVTNRGLIPPAATRYPIEVSDGTSEAITAGYSRAVRAVRALSLSEHDVVFTTNFSDPRWTRGDLIGVIEPVRISGERFARIWLVSVEAFSDDTDLEQKTYEGTGVVLSTVDTPATATALEGGLTSVGIVSTLGT